MTDSDSWISGRQHHLRHGEFTAVITEIGATLRQLRHGDRDLVMTYGIDEICPVFSGAVLAPWPNRIAHGRYTFDGRDHQLPLTEPPRSAAIHGLVSWVRWHAAVAEPDRVVLTHALVPQPGYPFALDLAAEYRLDDDGLHWSVATTNVGADTAPYGVGPHPYLVAGPGPVDDWTVELDASSYIDSTADRLEPTDILSVDGTRFDFRGGARVGDLRLDRAYTDVTAGDDGLARLTVTGPDGRGVQMFWDPVTCPWVQTFTTDFPDLPQHRSAFAAEPMSCPPNAFVNGIDVVSLEPGDTHRAEWTIAPVG